MKGPDEDPTISTTIKPDTADGKGNDNEGEDELVIMIAGGMTSKLTYDGIDVCASRVAWEVSRCLLLTILVNIVFGVELMKQIDQEITKIEEAGKTVARFSLVSFPWPQNGD